MIDGFLQDPSGTPGVFIKYSQGFEAIPWESPASSLERWSDLAPIEMQTLFESVIDHSVKLHHPRFMGHQISPSLPIAAVAGLVTDLLNNGMGVYEMGIAGTAIENTVVKATAAKLGFDQGADGFLTSGGSLANLTALVAAFEQLPTTTAPAQVAILVSEQAHYCVTRSAHLLGVEPEGIIRVATNDRYQTDVFLKHHFREFRRVRLTGDVRVGNQCEVAS